MNLYLPSFRLMECQTIVHWYRLYKPVGPNDDVSLLHLLRCWFSRLAFSQNWGQLTPEYTKLSIFFPTNGFLHTMKIPGFIGLKLWQRGLESMRHHFHTWRPQPHLRSLICTGKKTFGEEEKINHCKWLLGLKYVQGNVAFLYICWRDWVLCFSWWWQEKYTALLSVVILPPYVAWPFMLPRWRALCFAAFCALGVFRDELKWTRKVGGGALKLSQLSFPQALSCSHYMELWIVFISSIFVKTI